MAMPAEFELEVNADPVHYIAFDLNGTGKALAAFSVKFCGFALRNPSSSVEGQIDFYDATDTVGTVVFTVMLAGNESAREYWWPGGVLFKNGVYGNVTAGEVKGSIFYRHHRL